MRLASTFFGFPYSALGVELSSDYHSRTMIQSAREKYVLAGLILSAAMVAFSEEIFGRTEASFILSNISLIVVIMVPFVAMLVLFKVPEVPTFNAPPVSLWAGIERMLRNKLFFRLLLFDLLIAGGGELSEYLIITFLAGLYRHDRYRQGTGPLFWRGFISNTFLGFVGASFRYTLFSGLSYGVGGRCIIRCAYSDE